MLVSDLISLSMRTAGVLGVGQVALPEDLQDCSTVLTLLMQQWRQKRWLVFRLNWEIVPLIMGKGEYTVGVEPTNDIVTDGDFRPANIQSCYLRLETGPGPNSFPVDFPMQILHARQHYDRIRLKTLQSWPSTVYYDPIVPDATLYVWPIPVQTNFALYIAWQQAIDFVSEEPSDPELTDTLPAETQLALLYAMSELNIINYKLPPDPGISAAARSALNVLRMTNFALQPLQMPKTLAARRRSHMINPMGGFYPEMAAGIPYQVAGP